MRKLETMQPYVTLDFFLFFKEMEKVEKVYQKVGMKQKELIP